MLISSFPCHNVAWLYDAVSPDRIEDKDDLWVKTWGTPLTENHQGGQSKKYLLQREDSSWAEHANQPSPTRSLQQASNIMSAILVISVYLASSGLTGIIQKIRSSLIIFV